MTKERIFLLTFIKIICVNVIASLFTKITQIPWLIVSRETQMTISTLPLQSKYFDLEGNTLVCKPWHQNKKQDSIENCFQTSPSYNVCILKQSKERYFNLCLVLNKVFFANRFTQPLAIIADLPFTHIILRFCIVWFFLGIKLYTSIWVLTKNAIFCFNFLAFSFVFESFAQKNWRSR